MNYRAIAFNNDTTYIDKFVSLPAKIYDKNDLIQNIDEEKKLLKGEHCLSHYFKTKGIIVLDDNDEIVSRCMMTYYKEDNFGFIGFFESINDVNASLVLFEEALKDAKAENREKIVGPVDASFWIKYRLKTNKFERPYTGEPYNKDYYYKLFEAAGYKVIEKYSSNCFGVVPKSFDNSKYSDRLTAKLSEGYEIKSPDSNEFELALKQIYKLIIELYSDFPTYKFISEDEFIILFSTLKPVLNYSMVKLAYKDNEPVGFFVSIPNYSNLVSGKIGMLKVLKILKIKYFPKEYVMLYLGIDSKHHGLGKAVTEVIKEELKQSGCTSIGALIHEGKVTGTYFSELINDAYEYVLLEKII